MKRTEKERKFTVYGLRPDRRFKGYRPSLIAAKALAIESAKEKADGRKRYPDGVEIWQDEKPIARFYRGKWI